VTPGYAKKQINGQRTVDEGDLEDKLTDIWEYAGRDILEFVFFEWMERLEWVIEGRYLVDHLLRLDPLGSRPAAARKREEVVDRSLPIFDPPDRKRQKNSFQLGFTGWFTVERLLLRFIVTTPEE
jgi:hypothetical protein